MPGRLEFNVDFGAGASRQRRSASDPMRILLLGDFSGRGSRGLHDAPRLAERPVHRVDVDTLDQVLRKIAPVVALSSAGTATTIDFGALDDFHPDRLYERVAAFGRWRALRARLIDPATFESAADELRAQGLVAADGIPPARVAVAATESDAGTLGRLLGGGDAPRVAPRPVSAVDALLRDLVAPHIVADRSAQMPVYLGAIDAAIGEQMRRTLHDSAFASLESAWRGVAWLVSRLELNEELQLYLLDVTREELHQDALVARADIARSGLFRSIGARAVDEGPRWSLLAGLTSIGVGDLDDLASLGAIAAQAGAPLVLAAAPSLYGCDSAAGLADPLSWRALPDEVAELWSALRRGASAAGIALVAPRFLLRLPYGKNTDPTEQFVFEEQPTPPVHESFLWASGSLAVALQLGQAFSEGGWAGTANPSTDIEDLPAYTFRRDGEATLQPCGEACFGEQAGEALLRKGILPLLSHRQRAAIRLARLQSIADPAAALAGPWA